MLGPNLFINMLVVNMTIFKYTQQEFKWTGFSGFFELTVPLTMHIHSRPHFVCTY